MLRSTFFHEFCGRQVEVLLFFVEVRSKFRIRTSFSQQIFPTMNRIIPSLVIDVNMVHSAKSFIVVIAVLLLVMLAVDPSLNAEPDFPESKSYVHTFIESQGNWTYVEKPMFPVMFNDSQVGIGENWSIVCPLKAAHAYHTYCYGEWVNNGSEPKTDYDIYVYDPSGELEGYHTESAGLPEHLGTTTEEPFFNPRQSGNYTFVIVNDPKESNSSQQATFMIIENIECNSWHEHYVEGKNNTNAPVLNTTWAYEFATSSQHIEIWIKVPEALDMYEARLYLMSDPTMPNKTMLNDVPLAWEPGLFGERNTTLGGYNLESKEYRGVAYASCENYGQEMHLNFTAPHVGKSLYHLVLIGEIGSGTIEFLVKTEFGNATLKPVTVPYGVFPQNETSVIYVSNSTDLANATLRYTIDGWKNTNTIEMQIVDNRTCRVTIPGQNASTSVAYKVEAIDTLKNVLSANSSYSVKYPSELNLTLVHDLVHIGENATVKGFLFPRMGNIPVTVFFNSANTTKEILCHTLDDGTFTAGFQAESTGSWQVQARFDGTVSLYPCASSTLLVKIEEPTFLMKYSLYIGGGVAAVAVVGIVVYVKKSKA